MNFSLSAALFDLRQQKGCYRTQFNVNACVVQNIAVPLHRQKTFRIFEHTPLNGEAAKAKKALYQDNIINSRSGLTHRSE